MGRIFCQDVGVRYYVIISRRNNRTLIYLQAAKNSRKRGRLKPSFQREPRTVPFSGADCSDLERKVPTPHCTMVRLGLFFLKGLNDQKYGRGKPAAI